MGRHSVLPQWGPSERGREASSMPPGRATKPVLSTVGAGPCSPASHRVRAIGATLALHSAYGKFGFLGPASNCNVNASGSSAAR
jgi:hypothetical protein